MSRPWSEDDRLVDAQGEQSDEIDDTEDYRNYETGQCTQPSHLGRFRSVVDPYEIEYESRDLHQESEDEPAYAP